MPQPPEKTFHLSVSFDGVAMCGLGNGAEIGADIWRLFLTLSLFSELRDPLERLVPMGAILELGREGLFALSGDASGLDAVVVFVCVLSAEKRLKVADLGLGDSAGLESPRDR